MSMHLINSFRLLIFPSKPYVLCLCVCYMNYLTILCDFPSIIWCLLFMFTGTATSPRPVSRERERRTSTRLHRGVPTSSELARDPTRVHVSAALMQQGLISGINSGLRRGSASKDGEMMARATSARHLKHWWGRELSYLCQNEKRKLSKRIAMNYNHQKWQWTGRCCFEEWIGRSSFEE